MRWLFLVLAGCSFKPHAVGADDAQQHDASGTDSSSVHDAARDATGSATPDARVMATVSYIQGINGAAAASVATLILGQAVADGDLCVVGVAINGNAIASVTDSGGNLFTSVATGGSLTVYVAPNMRASTGDTITISFTGYTGYTAAAAVYRGLAPASPVDSTTVAAGTGTTLDSGSAQTSHAHDLLVGVAASNGTMNGGTGYTKDVGGTYSLIEHQEVTVAGSDHATATAGNVSWTMAEIALKAND